MKYVIIGNSAAAIGCISGIRTIDGESSITLISDEPHFTYSRPLISYWLKGKVTDDKMYYRSIDFYEKNNCTALLGKKAEKIDTNAKKVVLEDGSTVEYDKLLVATGSSPFVPPVEGLSNANNAFTFLNWDSAKAVKEAANKDSKVVIMGAGLIGLKAAEGLHEVCDDITVVDLADRVLPSILDAEGAGMVQKHIEKEGIKFLLNDAASAVKGNTIVLKSGKELAYDVLIVAVGVRPNTGLVKDAGGEVNRGIVTDSRQATSLHDVYSAGDCTESLDICTGQSKILALLPNAYFQGETAGINMAGGNQTYDTAMPMNAIGFFGLHMLTAGAMEGECFEEIDENNYKRMFFSDGLLKGFILIGEIDRAGIYTSLIREKTPMDQIDSNLLKVNPQLMVFDKKARMQKLAGGK
ncbi:NAD(P)/FAD-dependent oxidoreductase [Ruminiclostridium papyrosolvens]|uniref:FAD-dependent pyridine nucleotide-disulfide oxidoreductase n=1 Tax=Ruminiclostridium papyrosolvens C7 TaxID=1330534 RepID=U4R255_9FIRM|nr:FAD-dependent oxidoreductase [Ruminiclostridium papyrosolvens]EPR11703.1 FAD-dependent pyridine nucleotide-disulfide oxidoreductase [Ruminiclostridium papyrosolvens C7]